MDESVGDRGTFRGHYYTAAEVRARLEGFSGHSGHQGISGFSGIPGQRDLMRELMYNEGDVSFAERVSQWNYSSHSTIKPRRFSVRAFVREGIKDLKEYFQKKETKHG